jgi:hypothetical protein
MRISEERLHLLLPRSLKHALTERAEKLGVSVGEYVRRLIRTDLESDRLKGNAVNFPFGKNPIDTGRTQGSVDHDRAQ